MHMSEKAKRIVLLALITMSILPILLVLRLPAEASVKQWALFASALTGYLGLGLLLWEFMLGAKAFFRLWFQDLAPVLSMHKWLGKYGMPLIFLHPLLITYAYGESWLYSLVPQVSTEFERQVTLGRIAFFVLLLVWFTSAIVRDKIAFRPWKYLHYLVYIALPFAFLHVPKTGSQFSEHSGVRAYFFVLVGVFGVFLMIRLRGLVGADRVDYQVTRQQQLTMDVYMLHLRAIGSAISPRPGQYVYVSTGLVGEDHPFSVVKSSQGGRELIIVYRRYGRFTRYLSQLRSSSRLLVSGPYGAFMRNVAASRPRIYIAGGIGVTPFIDTLLTEKQALHQLFYINKYRDNSPLITELRQVLGKRLVEAYSQEPVAAREGEVIGRLNAEVIASKIQRPTEYDYYLCGSKDMTQSLVHELQRLGVPRQAIQTEAFAW